MKTVIEKFPSVDHPDFTFVVASIKLKNAIIRLSKEHEAEIKCIDYPNEREVMVYFRDEDDRKMEDVFKLIETYNAINS